VLARFSAPDIVDDALVAHALQVEASAAAYGSNRFFYHAASGQRRKAAILRLFCTIMSWPRVKS
jgi:hypothetical protein